MNRQFLRRIIREELDRQAHRSYVITTYDGDGILIATPEADDMLASLMRAAGYTRRDVLATTSGDMPIPSRWIDELISAGAVHT